MRKIKFRAWDKVEKKWMDMEDGSLMNVCHAYETGKTCFVDDIVYMQYTGLKDKNGKEIYEGDVIKITQKYGSKRKSLIREVLFTSGCFNINNWTLLYNLEKEYLSDIKVIGNIYENKELIK